MNLIIDQGNSVCKIAVFDDRQVIMSTSVSDLNEAILREVFVRYKDIDSLIYSSVGESHSPLESEYLSKLKHRLILSSDTPVPVEVLYDRSSLGGDRLAAVVGAYKLSQGAYPLLVIDAGTAITYEYIAPRGQYLGGNIAPGLWLRFKALNSFTSRLPLIKELPDEEIRLYGDKTQSAMTSGCVRGLEREIGAYIDEALRSDATTHIYMTGGDASFFAERLQRREIELIPELVLIGLNEILEYNKR